LITQRSLRLLRIKRIVLCPPFSALRVGSRPIPSRRDDGYSHGTVKSRSLPRLPALLVALALACVPVAKVFALISAPLVPPSNLEVNYVTPGAVALTWTPSPNPLVYYVVRSANGGP